jgi:hypothetical protein
MKLEYTNGDFTGSEKYRLYYIHIDPKWTFQRKEPRAKAWYNHATNVKSTYGYHTKINIRCES